ncbi:MAG: hypothetical protein QM621_10025 [Aeromicrobium sp.]|uniref:hypothetical protein n=1 Tax=Aeromicrobium sp. TaxID=1871063 RepID=UPI0039E64FA7
MSGGASGVVFAVVVIMWVAYVVPLVLRRYDEASTTSSLGSLTSLSRVIQRPGKRPAVEPEPEPVQAVERPAARSAARRRRRVLLALAALLAATVLLAATSVVGRTWVAVPAVLLTAWLVACRIQVRGEILGTDEKKSEIVPSWDGLKSVSPVTPVSEGVVEKESAAGVPEEKAARKTAADEEDTVIVSHQFEDFEPDRERVMEEAPLDPSALEEQLLVAATTVSTTGVTLWDPLPVTHKTYIRKPAPALARTVRTVDFTGASAADDVTAAPGEHGSRRAVGH